jgi:PAT family beta-lactamase induction signal transducer AmpG
MPALSESRRLRFLVLTMLYVAQGLPWGFISVGYVVFLTDLGLDNTAIGAALGLAYTPWSFKILAGPVLDRMGSTRWGRRRPFILVAQLLMGLSLLGLLAIDPAANLWWVGAILFAHNSAAALQDVAVDALAVDLLPDDERGTANSLMWAGKSLGVAIGGGGGTVLAGIFGWPALFVTLAVTIWAIMALPLLVREHPGDRPPPEVRRLELATLVSSFSFPAPWFGLLVALLTPAGYALVGAVTTRMLRADLHLSDAMIGTLSGVVDPIAAVAGALLGGLLADRIGARKVMGGAMVGISACLAAWGLGGDLRAETTFLFAWFILLNGLISAYNAASLGLFMSLSNPAIGATHFAAYMAATNLAYSWCAPAGGHLADTYGTTTTYLIAAGLQLATIALLPLADTTSSIARYRVVGAPPTVGTPAG